MLVVKKLVSRLPPVAASPGAKVFYLTDRRTNLGYLVDTRACESLIPKEMATKLGQRGPSLRAANGSPIHTFGKTRSTIRTPTASYAWQFLIADIFIPIIGADWTEEADAAFHRTKTALAAATNLSYPSPNAELQLSTDASDIAVGAVLNQKQNGIFKPLGFFSRKLSDTEKRYSTFDRELLAVHQAVRHFKHLLQGKSFKIMTDHLPLVHAFSKKSDPESNRQQRQLAAIAEYNCTLHHLPGKSNCVADALSRGIIAATDIGLDLNQLERLQKDEEEEARKNTSLSFVRMLTEDKRHSILCDNSTGRLRPWIPRPMRKTAFDIVHNLSHPSRRTTCKLLTQKFVWQSIKKDAQQWAKTCQACQTCKIHRHTESGVGEFPQPRRRFGHIHVDIVGPLPASKTYRYLLTIIDRSTRWPEAIPMQTATTETCVEANRVG